VTPPLVLKLGGDALATPERIAAAARLVKQRLDSGPVVAVASARRGVTDHLLGLVERVKDNTPPAVAESSALAAAAERALAAGELVGASLLAVALNRLGVSAQVLDAREAGLRSDGQWGRAQITGVRPAGIARLLERGAVPVVTGFQGWHRGRLTTLGRGGSDTAAVTLATTLGALRCELVKHAGGIFTADPTIVPEARLIPRVSHHFLSALAASGAKVISYRAAVIAERESIPLRFCSLESEAFHTNVHGDFPTDVLAVAHRPRRYRLTSHLPGRVAPDGLTSFRSAVVLAGICAELDVTEDGTGSRLELVVDAGDMEASLALARRFLPRGRTLALLATGLTTVTLVGAQRDRVEFRGRSAQWSEGPILRRTVTARGTTFLVRDADGEALVRALHAFLDRSPSIARIREPDAPSEPLQLRRSYVGQR
jgi:aspartate kinase